MKNKITVMSARLPLIVARVISYFFSQSPQLQKMQAFRKQVSNLLFYWTQSDVSLAAAGGVW